MKYSIERMVLGSSAVIPISKNEFNEIARAKSGLLESRYVEEKFDMVIENFLELETTLLESAARNMLGIRYGHGYDQSQRDLMLFSRRLVNLLTTGRGYIDQAPQHVKNALVRQTEADDIKLECSKQYNSLFGYRVMESLRNYVQHRGFPLQSVSFPSNRIGNAEGSALVFRTLGHTNRLVLVD